MTIMENSSDVMFKYVFKRIIYFNPDYKDVVIRTTKIIKDEILKTNSCHKFECIIYMDSIGIYCNIENVIKQFERFLISKLPDNSLIYPHYTVHSINFEDIRRFQTHTHLPLGQFIDEAIKVLIILFYKSVKW